VAEFDEDDPLAAPTGDTGGSRSRSKDDEPSEAERSRQEWEKLSQPGHFEVYPGPTGLQFVWTLG
jgi:hypothetical protein